MRGLLGCGSVPQVAVVVESHSQYLGGCRGGEQLHLGEAVGMVGNLVILKRGRGDFFDCISIHHPIADLPVG